MDELYFCGLEKSSKAGMSSVVETGGVSRVRDDNAFSNKDRYLVRML